MRDIAVTVLVFGSLPFILRRPWIGIIVWTWLGFMNPHRMAWGFSTTMPFAAIVAITTLVALAASREPKRMPWTRETVVLLIFVCWMMFTTIFAVYPSLAVVQLEKVLKIQFMIFVALILINSKERLNALVLTIALSLGFYGVKGGIFTIAHGGVYRVQGPPGSFIGGNNEIGLALAMTVPLLYYCSRQAKHVWMRYGLIVAMVLTVIAAVGTQSRGALVGIATTGVIFWLKSKQKVMVAIYAVVTVAAIVAIMPQAWYDRISTIETYQKDRSAQGRINAWTLAWNVARVRPLGGGFEMFQPGMFRQYAPNPRDVHDVHSIYFEVLGEHGFVGLSLFLMLGAFTWLSASRIRRQTARIPELRWLGELTSMVQVAMVGYYAAGTFLGMAYFDYLYNLVLIVVVARTLVAEHHRSMAAPRQHDTAVTDAFAAGPPTRPLGGPRGAPP